MKYQYPHLSKPGYTLLSLLIALAIASLLLLMGTYGIRTWFTRNQSTVVAQRLQLALNYARQVANTQGLPVTLCATDNGAQCGEHWSAGQLVFQDDNRNKRVDSHDKRLRVLPGLKYSAQLRWRGLQSRAAITFLPLGMGARMNGAFEYDAGEEASPWNWRLVVNRVGRTRLSPEAR